MARKRKMTCSSGRKGVRICSVGDGRVFMLHPGKSNKTAKAAAGRRLHKRYTCARDRTTGQFKSCKPKRQAAR